MTNSYFTLQVQSNGGDSGSGSGFETGRETDSPRRCGNNTASGSNGESDEMGSSYDLFQGKGRFALCSKIILATQ